VLTPHLTTLLSAVCNCSSQPSLWALRISSLVAETSMGIITAVLNYLFEISVNYSMPLMKQSIKHEYGIVIF
jgi:hypothetical protein